ncbi:MAG TPA: OmpH family outer membrane protein [Paracoccaceae bacterium]|nr:OmpH family outer membrane protein [Paracoccaceae bacterium]
MRNLAVAFCLGLLALFGGQAAAQDSTAAAPAEFRSLILTINLDQLFGQTLYGQRIRAEIDLQAKALETENRTFAEELQAQERSLTERRPTMDPADFRIEADAFDAKVQAIRQSQDEKELALQTSLARGRDEFLSAVQGVLAEIMISRGAVLIIDRRNIVMQADLIDITETAIATIDERLGDGSTATPASN